MAAAKGNNYAGKAKAYEGAIKRALARRFGSVDDGLNAIADKLVEDAIAAEDAKLRINARQEIADRLDGKPKQQTEISGADGGPIMVADATKLTDDELAAIAANRSE